MVYFQIGWWTHSDGSRRTPLRIYLEVYASVTHITTRWIFDCSGHLDFFDHAVRTLLNLSKSGPHMSVHLLLDPCFQLPLSSILLAFKSEFHDLGTSVHFPHLDGQESSFQWLLCFILQNELIVASANEVVQLPMASCGAYKNNCGSCVLSRDPYCGWINEKCTSINEHENG